MKTVTKKYLKSLEGKDPSSISLEGWKIFPIPFGHAVSLQLIRDRIDLWLNEDGLVKSASTRDRDQTV